MALSRPKLWWQFSFNADPNDTAAVRLWTDYTHLVRKVGENRRGRNYELALSSAASPPITWRDVDEILNPSNTDSPHYPDVEPYRAVLGQAMWPNPEISLGSAVNLINSERWKPNKEAAADPSFESYADGEALPGWLTAIGDVVATVSTTDPQQGTKALAIPTLAGGSATMRQGVSWEADCVPGQQYTSSAYVRQASASTLRLSVTGQTLAWDEFATASASTWGTAPLGGAWTNTGGVDGDFTKADDKGLISVTATASDRFTTLDVGNSDAEIIGLVSATSTPVGAGTQQGFTGRYTDASNHYIGYVAIDTSGLVTAEISRRVAGVLSAMAVENTTVHSGANVMVRFQCHGRDIKLKVWDENFPEPADWTATATDTTVPTGTRYGCFARRNTSQTSPTVFAFERVYTVGYVSGTTTTTTGSYVRLSVTFTATQPSHTVEITNFGNALAQTVRLDAVQHEIGASANAFSTTGPVIFPILGNYAERFPREYEAAGFVGKTVTPAVDGFAALNAISIPAEYVAAVLESAPAYYWTLGGGAGTLQALEISGNNGPALVRYDSKYGPGTAPVFGTAIEIAGKAGATGVRFFPTAIPGAVTAGSMLSAGRIPSAPGIVFPRAYTSLWGVSISVWFHVNGDDAAMIIAFPGGTQSPGTTAPIALVMQGFGDGFPDIRAIIQSGLGGSAQAVTNPFSVEVGQTYHVVATVSQSSFTGNTTISVYLNGVLEDTNTVASSTLSGHFTVPATFVNVGDATVGGQGLDGVVSDFSLWERTLTADEVAALYEAGTGFPGDTTGQRFERHLLNGRYAGARRISTGSTTLQPATWQGSIDLLTDGQQLALAEAGTFWMAPDGAAVMEDRQDRWLRLASTATFGEDVASGEIPYLDGITFDNDPTFVYANVQITRNGGAVARGGTTAEISRTQRKYFGRSYAIGADFEDDLQAQDYADWVFSTHKAPLVRVASLTIDPSAYPTIWNKALNIEVGQRVTVKRRAKAGNSGAGLTMSAEYFIEAVIHSEIDFDKTRWRIGLMLSPIGTVPSPSFQPWILENATYGVLDSTTILGF